MKAVYMIYTPLSPQIFARCKGIQDSPGIWIPYRGFRIYGSGIQSLSVELGFWLPFVIEISNSLSCIPDSTSKIFPDLLTRGINKPCDQRPFDLHR